MRDGILSAVLDTLYPPVCVGCGAETGSTAALCPSCFGEAAFITGATCERCGVPMHGASAGELICNTCRQAPPAWDRGRAAALYEGSVRRAILALKHGDRLDIARAAAPWLLHAGADMLREADHVVPVPLHWTRLLRRRANQSAELARALCALADRQAAYAPLLLHRTRATPSQEGRTREARQRNMADAFGAGPDGDLDGKAVLLIDDVMTTGATLSACATTLRAAGAARVDVLVMARVAHARDLAI